MYDLGFYVYGIYVDGVLRYIGKGCGDRYNEHVRTVNRIMRLRQDGGAVRTSRFYNRLVRAVANNCAIEVKLIHFGMDEPSAFAKEIDEIAIYSGSRQLWNTFAGGNGFSSEWLKSRWRDPAYREARSKRSRDNWLDPDFRKHQIELRNSAEHRERVSKSLVEALARPGVRKVMSERKKALLTQDPAFLDRLNGQLRASHADKAVRQKSRERKLTEWRDPERRAKIIASFKTAAARPERRKYLSEKAKAQMSSEDMRRRISESGKALWRDPAYRSRIMAALKAARDNKKRRGLDAARSHLVLGKEI